MKQIFCQILALLVLSKSAFSNPPKNSSQIILFYNSLSPCSNCQQITQQIIQIISQNYTPKDFQFYLINLKYQPHYINLYHLSSPLNLVLISYYDGFYNGYKKINYSILNQQDIISLSKNLKSSINNFFNLPTINYQKISN